jgi:hypothetical protein
LTSTKIAKILNDEGIPTAQVRKQQQGITRNWVRSNISYWQASKVTQILSEERYTGTMISGKRERVEIGKNKLKRKPESEWIVVPGVIPVIISNQQFEKVRKMMSARASPHLGGTPSSLILARKLKCGVCGHALRPNKYSGNVHYYCDTRNVIAKQDCLKGYIKEDDIKTAVLAVLRQQISLAEQVMNLKKAKSTIQTVDGLNGEIQNLRRLIEKSKTTKMSIWEKYHSGTVTKEAFQRESEKLSEQTATYEIKIAELESERKILELQSGEANTFVERHIKYVGITELTREVLDIFVKEILVYSSDRIEVILNFADEYEKVSKQVGVGV